MSIKVFVKVAQCESFTRAADQLGLSRAMVTKHIMQLENSLGVRLLNRTTRTLSLTEIGLAYRDRCVQILAGVDEADSLATQFSSKPTGVLRVTAPTSFGTFHLAPVAADYMVSYPDVEVFLSLNDQVVDLAKEGLDLAIRLTKLVDSSLVAQKIAHARMVVCGAPAYFERHGVPQTPQDLLQHNCLRYAYRTVQDGWEFIGPEGAITVPVAGSMESNVGDALRMAAIQGLGIVLQPTYMVGADLKEGRLQAVLTGYEPVGVDVNAVYLHRKHLSAKVRTFVDFLKDRFQAQPHWDDWRHVQ